MEFFAGVYADMTITARIQANLDVRKLPRSDFEALNRIDRGRQGRIVDLSSEWGVRLY